MSGIHTTAVKKKGVSFILFPLFVLPFFEPNIIGALEELSVVHILVLIWQCLSIIVGAVLFMLLKNKTRNKSVFILFAFSISLIISTIVNKADVLHSVFYSLELFTIVSFCLYYVDYKQCFIPAIRVLYHYFSILVMLNLITMLLFPSPDDFGYWIFSNKNNHIYYLIPYLFFAVCKNELERYSSTQLILPFTLSLFIVLLGKSTTSLFSMLVLILLLLIFNNKHKIRKSILGYFFLFSIIISFLFIVTNNIIYLDAIVSYYDKEETFGRFEIWEKAMDLVQTSPLIGAGIEPEEEMIELFNFTHCHNKYLDITYMGGLCGLLLFLSFIFFSCINLNKYRNRVSLTASLILCAYAIEFLMEGKRADMGFYLVFLLLPYTVKTNLRKKKLYENRIL